MTQVLDTVDVLRRDDTPAHFLWQGRLYAVRAILKHWVERDDGTLGDHDRELWRVRAAAGRRADPEVFDLCFAWARSAWTLAPVPHGGVGDEECEAVR